MDAGNSWRKLQVAVVVVGMAMQSSPIAWAALETVDPALHAAVEALVSADPEIAGNAELAQICRQVAESTVLDPRERAAVTSEVAAIQREGVDIGTVIPKEVREAAREQFTKVQGEMREQLEKLRASDPEKAKEIELTMREGERQMLAFESGERYTPSPEMVAHAQEMFGDWEKDMIAQGAPPEFVERAKLEFAAWSGGEHTMGFGGPGQEFAGRAGPPTTEQMQAMGMTPDQIQAAMAQQQYIEIGSSGHMPTLEQMQAMGMTPDQIQAAQQYEASGNFGVNPSTGGWEPNMGGTAYTTGGWESTYSGGTTHWEGGSNYGINPATGGWEPGMGGAVYTGGETWTSGGTTDQWSNTTEQRQDLQTTTTTAAQEVHENAIHLHGDVEHVHDIHVHTDSTRHDHTATSPADTAPNSVFQ